MDQVFKAYDVRGTVPDQLDADMCRAIGRAMARFAGTPRDPGRPRHARVAAWSCRPPSPTACGPRGSTSPTSAWPPPTSCTSPRATSTRPAPCSRRRTTRRSTTASSSASPGARPIGRDTGLADIEAEAEELLGEPLPPLTGALARAGPARRVGRPRRVLRRRRLAAPAQGRGRHGQRHGRAGGADRVRAAPLLGRDPLPRARRHLPEPPGRPDPAREPGRR